MVATPSASCPNTGETRVAGMPRPATLTGKRATLVGVDAKTRPVAARLTRVAGEPQSARGRAGRGTEHLAAHHGARGAPIHQVRAQRDLGARRGRTERRSVQLWNVRVRLADAATRFGRGQATLLALGAKHEFYPAHVQRTGQITARIRARTDTRRARSTVRRAARERPPRAPLLPLRLLSRQLRDARA